MGEPETFTTTRHRCPGCRRSWAKKAAARAHIARCWQVRENRGCKTCALFQPYQPSKNDCQPGALCACSEQPEECQAGVDISGGLKTGCPQWEAIF